VPRRLGALAGSGEVGLALLVLLFAAAFAALTPGFASPFNLYALSRAFAINAVIGLAMMVVIVTGGLNLALGAIGVSAVMLGGWLMQEAGAPAPAGIAGALLLGALLGLANGLLVVRMGVHSFVVTLATMSLYFVAMLVLTRAEAFSGLPPGFTGFGRLRHFGWVSALVPVALGTALLLALLFRLTALGREILAAGANARAAALSGVAVGRAIVVAHALSGALAGLAGVMLAMRNSAAIPGMAGQLGADWLLPAFLAPVLGGTPLTGGAVSVSGTVLGALLVTLLSNGLLQLRVGEFWVQAFLGLILLAAVALDRLRAGLALRRRGAPA
jgi:ribose transport system permease protein